LQKLIGIVDRPTRIFGCNRSRIVNGQPGFAICYPQAIQSLLLQRGPIFLIGEIIAWKKITDHGGKWERRP
jgi:hypothetical protein